MNAPTAAELATWPLTVDVPTAGRCFRLGREASYLAVRRDEFPVPVIRVGKRLVVVTAHLREALGVGPPDGENRPGPTAGRLTTETERDTEGDCDRRGLVARPRAVTRDG